MTPKYKNRWLLTFFAAMLVLFVGYFDYWTGLALRVFPLYFVPVGFLAWHAGKTASISLSLVAISAWEIANRFAGMEYKTLFYQVWNVLVQWGSLVAFAILLSRMRDLVERERANSRTDSLTGLANGRAFGDALSQEIERARRKKRPTTIAYVDLDNFKMVNDQKGHQAGDDVLVSVATLMRAACRQTDYIARLGGDEFAIIAPETNQQEANLFLERIHKNLLTEMKRLGLPVSASIGAVVFYELPNSQSEMIQRADALMYRVKSSGKNSFLVESFGSVQT